ncbi:MAG TPA: hypothetical protein VMT86_16815 [Bryobacteraceae bacterium]|nr:hypothetical protein [Bryobacteraceae bacterium]
MRFASSCVIGVFLALAGSQPIRSQDPPATQQQPDQYFAGFVTALSETSITVTRTVLGKSTVRTFAITHDTVIQGGKPKVKSKVTVKWTTGDSGDQAVKIILRGGGAAPKKQ